MKIIFSFKLMVITFTIITLTSCASIASRSISTLHIRTDPRGASISITNKRGKEIFKGISPAIVNLKNSSGYFSKAEYQVKMSIPGYPEKIIPVQFKLNNWYWGNLVFGGLIGMLVIDPVTGAMWKIKEPFINEKFVKETVLNISEPTLKIINIEDLPNNLIDKIEKIY